MQDLYAAIWEKSAGPAWEARHRMNAADYQATFNDLAHKGYRLLCVSGYDVGGHDMYAALWDKSAGAAWEAHHAMDAAQFQTTFDALRARGFRLRSVCGYSVGPRELYAAIWDQATGPAWEAHHRMSAAQYQQMFNQLQAKGYRLTWVSTYAVGGQDLYAAVWEHGGAGAWEAHHRMSSATLLAKNAQLAARGMTMACVDACNTGGDDLYVALWHQPALPGALDHYGMNAPTYQQFFDQAKAQGLRPVVVSGYAGAQPVDAVLTFSMQKQLQSNWCWAATSVSIAHYYDPASTWTQCSMANGQLSRTDCCGAGASGPCNVYGVLDGSLTRCGHLDHATGGTIAAADVRTEVVGGRPLGIRVAWSGGGAHFIAATGIEEGDLVFVSDCGSGTRSVVAYTTLVTAYAGSGSWTNSYFTKA